MKSSSRKSHSRSAPGWSQPPGRSRSHPALWKSLVLCSLLYVPAGLLLAAFSVAIGVWVLAIAATLVQIMALAGPQTLQRFRWLPASLLALLGMIGAGGFAAALSIALNHVGSDQLKSLTLSGIFLDVLKFSLLAVGLTALCSSMTASTGDRLMGRFSRSQVIAILSVSCLLGLGIGAGAGYLLV